LSIKWGEDHRFCVAAEVGIESKQVEICVNDAQALDEHLDNLYTVGHSTVVLEDFGDPRLHFVTHIYDGCNS